MIDRDTVVADARAAADERIRPRIWMGAVVAVMVAILVAIAMPERHPGNDSGNDSAGEAAELARSPDPAAVPRAASPGAGDASTHSQGPPTRARERTLTEIAAASASFRNTTFLLAIHDAGYVCEVVAEVLEIGEQAAAWRVRCPQAFAYELSVGMAGELLVTPTPDLIDGNNPRMPFAPRIPTQVPPETPPDLR